MSSDYNETNKKIHIEKFEGSFSKEQSGCSILVNSTINVIKDGFALGVYTYLMCRPDNWKINTKQLMSHFECGKDKVQGTLLYLKKMGLLTADTIREKGKFVRYHYMVHLHPKPQLNQEILPEPEKPAPVNPTTYKTKNIKNKDSKNNNKTTTTVAREEKKTISSSSSVITPEIDKKLLALRDEYIYRRQNKEHDPKTDRSDEEFLKQCSHHLDNGDKQKYNLVRRLKGLETIIKSGFFETPAGYNEKKVVKSLLTPEETALLSKYEHGIRMSKFGQDMSIWVNEKEMKEVNRILDKIKSNEKAKPLKLKDILAKVIPQ